MPGLPDLFLPIVDVRDVAAAHVLAITHAQAAGERFLLSNGPSLAMKEIAAIIKAALGEKAHRVPRRSIPNVVLRFASLFNPGLRHFVPDLGYVKKTSNAKARQVLEWQARDPRDAIVDAAKSMIPLL
jgi:nucleoside-diphosphate-sugar epimerase